jgi:hypothetical protein
MACAPLTSPKAIILIYFVAFAERVFANLMRPTPIQLPTADVPAGVALQLVSGGG